MLGARVLGDQDRADRPLTAETESLEGAEHQQRLVVGRETAGHGEHRVGDHRDHQRLDPADPVREHARDGAADRGDDQGDGGEQPGLAAVEAEVRRERDHAQRQREVVVRVQGVAAERAAEGAAAARAERPQPGERAFVDGGFTRAGVGVGGQGLRWRGRAHGHLAERDGGCFRD